MTLDAALADRERAGIEERLGSIRALAKERKDARKRIRGVSLLAAAVVIASVILVVMRRPSELTFSIAGASGRAGEWVAATSEPVAIGFSDGTRITLAEDARARVLEVSPRGARIALERGKLTAEVVHRAEASWAIVAGPFVVHVIGTHFDADWDAALEALTVKLFEGRVEITGTCLSEARAVAVGESVRLSCRQVPPPTEAPPEASTTPSAAASARTPIKAPSWRELFRRADYRGAFEAAEREGIDAIAARSGAAELLELADLARLAKRPDVAQRQYLAIRSRFGREEQAATAAFHLGRMSFTGAPAEAERWFSTYLAERPSGAFAAEAMGRLLEIQHRAGHKEAAKKTAERYLTAFPNGGHAALARSILGS
ncbi:MAG TPA: FecR domain-containing protein [Polyangiaceae bacterium]|nr:FecR domain-containing protein [Polyangiaceae bacterium]